MESRSRTRPTTPGIQPVPKLGIRREDKHEWERRVPLTPELVHTLVAEHGIEVVVQPSPIRAFSDASYRSAGASVGEDLDPCEVVFAVKEIPISLLREGGAYVFFSHTIKGQPHNMPLLQRIMDLGCTLIDYERIVDTNDRRLVFFGRHAGLAGMVDTLHVTGRRLAALGTPSPFEALQLTHHYEDLQAVRAAIGGVGERIEAGGIPASLAPFVVGFAGYGNVSRGAQEIFDLLPVETIEPAQLPGLAQRASGARDRVFKVEFREQDLVEPTDAGAAFDLQHYYDHPEAYRSVFAGHLQHLSVLVNGIFWTDKYPRLVRTDDLRTHASRLIAIGDIGCDIDGAVQCTTKATTPGEPAYVFDPATGTVRDGVQGPGVAMMTTDCLPCELSKDASESFAAALAPFAAAIAQADYTAPLQGQALPDPIRSAVIVWRGELAPAYAHLAEHLT